MSSDCSQLITHEPCDDSMIMALDDERRNIALNQRAKQIADVILASFDKHYRIFSEITRHARTRFVRADWDAEQKASRKRITLYTKRVTEASLRLQGILVDTSQIEPSLWKQVKKAYIHRLYEHLQPELAETFYNSVFTWSFDRRYYNNDMIFVRPSKSTEYLIGNKPVFYSFYPNTQQDSLQTLLCELLSCFDIGLPFENRQRDIKRLVDQFENNMCLRYCAEADAQIQVISSLFYRNKAAYIVGRISTSNKLIPFAIPLLQNEQSRTVFVDAILCDIKDIMNLFSFARAYFMVETDVPSAVVRFLLEALPNKTAADLYTAIGLQKQGKSEFYRGFLHHLKHSNDKLEISRGTKGMVMSVFTLPSYPFVFKVINDRFAPPKEVTRKVVKQKYQLVKMHDRVGRMADTLEFSYVAFPLERFSDELLEELHAKIPKSIEIDDDQLIIRHLYIERRLEPLNLYLESADDKQLEDAFAGYGYAIKELAAANIFPGDLLLKNFGVSSQGRVIFYDYDEIELLQDCNFRVIPPPRYPEDEMSAEPWYSVAQNDVFPEEFLPFIAAKPKYRKLFLKYHADLLNVAYWKSVQKDISQGIYHDIFPYSQKIRFQHIYSDSDRAVRKIAAIN